MYLRVGILIIAAVCCWDMNAALGENNITSSNSAVSQNNLSLAIKSFALDLMKILQHTGSPDENVLISPFSIFAGLSLLHLGATGTSRNELADAMKLPKDENHLTEMHKNLGEIFNSIVFNWTSELESVMANSMFLQKDFQIKDEYLQKLKAYYNRSLVDRVDFVGAEASARNKINKWVSENTNGNIPEIFSEPFDANTVLVLANAVFFNARWKNLFERYFTKVDKFKTGSTQIDVQMMISADYVRYCNNPSLQSEIMELPYVGDSFSVYFMLPYETQNVMNLTNHLGLAEMQEIRQQLKITAVEYSVPRMKFKWSESLNEPLRQMGLKNIYTAAELGDMVFEKNLKLSKVKHVTDIEVNEEGTTASAATVVVIAAPSVPVRPYIKDAVKFTLNKPFLLAIVYRPSGIPLFTGIVRKP